MSRKNWKPVTATVFSREGPNVGTGSEFISVTFSYQVEGEWYSGFRKMVAYNSDVWQKGYQFTLLYDPTDPNRTSMNDPVSNRLFAVIATILGIMFVIIYLWVKLR